jgi:hypothetical protein
MGKTPRDGGRPDMPRAVVLNRGIRGGAEQKIRERH